MSMRYVDLFDGLNQGIIPPDGGWIFVARFHKDSNYGIFEIISYANVQKIERADFGVEMFSRGLKVFMVYEPLNYPLRFMEPYLRSEAEQVPLRFEQLETVETASRDRILISKEPYLSMGSFVIETPRAGNFVYYVYENEAKVSIHAFVTEFLRKDFHIETRTIERVLSLIDANLDQISRKRDEGE